MNDVAAKNHAFWQADPICENFRLGGVNARNYIYALGLRPKEIGDYLGSKRYYIVSSKIRMKLGLDKNGTNLGAFIKGEIGREWDQ